MLAAEKKETENGAFLFRDDFTNALRYLSLTK